MKIKKQKRLSDTAWWKIECLDCGVNADLLRDLDSRVVCRDCLNKHEFNEVDNEMYALQNQGTTREKVDNGVENENQWEQELENEAERIS